MQNTFLTSAHCVLKAIDDNLREEWEKAPNSPHLLIQMGPDILKSWKVLYEESISQLFGSSINNHIMVAEIRELSTRAKVSIQLKVQRTLGGSELEEWLLKSPKQSVNSGN